MVLGNSDALPGVPRLRYPNWRSLTGIERKWNARRRRTAGSAQLAFVYRDMAEIERRKRPATVVATRAVLPGAGRLFQRPQPSRIGTFVVRASTDSKRYRPSGA